MMSSSTAPSTLARRGTSRPLDQDKVEDPHRSSLDLPTFAQGAPAQSSSEGLLKRLQRLAASVGGLKGEEPKPRAAPVVHERPTKVFD